MSSINKQIYDAFMAAKVPDEIATKAAESVVQEDISARLAVMESRLAVVESRLAMVEKLEWIIVVGVIGLVIRAFLP